MSKNNNQSNNDIYILGTSGKVRRKRVPMIFAIIGGITVIALLIGIYYIFRARNDKNEEVPAIASIIVDNANETEQSKGYIERAEETINDVPLYIYQPFRAKMSLSLTKPEKNDSSVLFVAQAADVRADNGEIVGEFVLNGQILARGKTKSGFCAIINGEIFLGISTETDLLQKAIDTKGSFFRQYPLVKDGEIVINNIRNKSIRRALAIRNGNIIMVESRSNESFYDFSMALVDIGVTQAIYLVGSTTHGWWVDKNHKLTEFGVESKEMPPNTSYIIWQKK